ncbi:MAG: phosphoribosylamine--glycine ligase [Clostridia bacterium]
MVIGSGGREHAICWSLARSKNVEKIYCLPGNAGIAEIAECHDIGVMDFDRIVNFLDNHKDIGLTVVAPDDPLANGLVDLLEEKGYKAFGPRKNAAIIEASKAFSKNLMRKYNIPTADYREFDDFELACEYVRNAKFPLVVKADGLALGKGVVICQNLFEGLEALKEMMVDLKFSSAGNKVVIEEFMVGREVSILCFTDGKTIIPMVSSQDHKRAYDDDKGLNTGGMGTFSPSKFYTDEMSKQVFGDIIVPTIKAMEQEGRTFKGVLYFGLMLTADGIKVLEYNARFGDPETQVILPRLESDLLDIFLAIVDEKLDTIDIKWSDNACVCVVVASGGYPEKYYKGLPIEIGKLDDGVMLFHAGTKILDGKLVTNGGRVIGVTACGKDIDQAREIAYRNVEKISFDKMFYRKDIGIKK